MLSVTNSEDGQIATKIKYDIQIFCLFENINILIKQGPNMNNTIMYPLPG